ncbi:MAG TPA: iron-containing alcohol dehydrogenase [Dehalococcoidia bacterium]|nr:iron-containing alcohol dehydrogenase [Dehalococcoidia bacterium]
MKLNTNFRYLAPASRVHAGVGALSQLYGEAKRAGLQRAFVISSETLARTTDLADKVKDALGDLYIGMYDGAKKESPIPMVMRGVEAVKAANPDLIVALGGGSAVVTARAITIIVGEGKTIEEMYTKHIPGQAPIVYRANKPKIANIQVNTTPTTGADRGGAAVYDTTPPHRKELYDPKTRPLAMIIDPEALLTAPVSLYLDTSLSTFGGLIHALQSPEASPLSYADCRQALELSLTYLPQLVAHPEDGEARLQLFMCALMANRASQSTYNIRGRNIATGLGTQLRYRYPHIGQGASGAVMLTTDLRLNKEIMAEGQARVAEVLGLRRPGMSDLEAAEFLGLYVETFLKSIGVATRLRELNVPKEDFRRLAEEDAAMPHFGEGLNRVTDVDKLVKILEMAY